MTPDAPKSRIPITVPQLGTGTSPVRVSAWLVDVGQTLIAGDRIVEVLVPGITFDIETAQTGELIEIAKPVDSIVTCGDVLGWIAVEA